MDEATHSNLLKAPSQQLQGGPKMAQFLLNAKLEVWWDL